LRALRGLSGFRAEAKFSTWLTRIAWNVVQDEVARRDRQQTTRPPDEFHSKSNPPESVLLHRELDEQIQAALAELSPKLRAAIVLTGFRSFTAEEAAEMEGCTASTMYWRIHEARRLLELRLARYLSPP
jgi:RNA polymerase sigma-70 factor, ECF subfamily